MSLYGYARVSTIEQDLALQRTALKAAGCDIIRAEKASGARRDGRTELQVLLDFLRPGDALVVTRIDRLARSMKDLQDIVHELKEKGVALRATEQPIDTGTAAGKAFLDMLGVFAEFETNLRRERQMEGIAAAKARGAYKGRSPKIDPAAVRQLRDEEKLGPAAIARRLGIGRASVYRVLGRRGGGVAVPIRAELRPLYPAHWRELSRRVRFERAAGRCQGCGRPHLAQLRCLPDGRWFDEAAATWRDRRGPLARWPDLVEATRLRTTRVVLAAAHLDSNPANNRLANLRAFCQRCHMLHDRPHHLAQRWITYRRRYALGDLFLGRYETAPRGAA